LLAYAQEISMPDRIDKDHPVIQREIHGHVDQALRSRGLDLDAPIRADLLNRADLDYGYRNKPPVRFRSPDNVLLSASDCLDALLSATERTTSTSPGPKRIPTPIAKRCSTST
jgi:hypothetical protein